jgi:hypothetical protein
MLAFLRRNIRYCRHEHQHRKSQAQETSLYNLGVGTFVTPTCSVTTNRLSVVNRRHQHQLLSSLSSLTASRRLQRQPLRRSLPSLMANHKPQRAQLVLQARLSMASPRLAHQQSRWRLWVTSLRSPMGRSKLACTP